MSPVAWNIAFESFLENFKTGSVKVTGFADDAALFVTGPNTHILWKLMQEAVDKALSYQSPKVGSPRNGSFQAKHTYCWT